MQHYSIKRSCCILAALGMALVLVSLFSLSRGAIDTSVTQIFLILFPSSDSIDPQLVQVVQQIRVPRLLLGIIVGAGLAVSGCVMQALFRNPMADPGLLGVSSGAALGAITTIVLGIHYVPKLMLNYGTYLLPAMAFIGGLLTLLIVYRLARTQYRVDIPTMLLAGVAMNAITGALIGLLSYIADDTQLRDLIFWSLGSLEITNWWKLNIAIVIVLSAIVAMILHARPLNACLLGENEARHLGINVERLKQVLVVLVALIVGVCVALSGVIGFVGLLVPHLLRMSVGPDHRLLLAASAIFGALLLVGADIIARTLIAPAEIPIGIVTALLGGPFFLWLLIRYRNRLPA